MISAHSQADGPVYLTTAVEDTVQLYLAPIGEWGSEAKAVKSIKRYLRDEGFTIESVQRLSAQYGMYHIPCIQFRCSGRLDKQLKLTSISCVRSSAPAAQQWGMQQQRRSTSTASTSTPR